MTQTSFNQSMTLENNKQHLHESDSFFMQGSGLADQAGPQDAKKLEPYKEQKISSKHGRIENQKGKALA